MVDRLAAIRVAVDHRPVTAISNSLLQRDFLSRVHHVGDNFYVRFAKIIQRADMTPRNYEDMCRSFRTDIPKSNYIVVFKDDIGRHFSACNLAENTIGHRDASVLNLCPDQRITCRPLSA